MRSDKKKTIGTVSMERKLQHILIRHLNSFEVGYFRSHTLYKASFPLMGAFLELLFGYSEQLPRRTHLGFHNVRNILPLKWHLIFEEKNAGNGDTWGIWWMSDVRNILLGQKLLNKSESLMERLWSCEILDCLPPRTDINNGMEQWNGTMLRVL